MSSIQTLSVLVASAVLSLAVGVPAQAQDLGALKGLAGGADLSSLASGTTGNAAGIIEFCVRNNYLGNDAAAAVKDKLLGKISGSDASADDKAGYDEGAKGVLKSSDGRSVDLAKVGEMKKSMTKKACASVLEHAKSLL